MPYDENGKFAGAICEDIELGTLETAVGNLKYHGEGKGLLISPKGNIIASTDEDENMKPVSDNAALAAHFDEMVQKGEGYFSLDTPEGKKASRIRPSRRRAGSWASPCRRTSSSRRSRG